METPQSIPLHLLKRFITIYVYKFIMREREIKVYGYEMLEREAKLIGENSVVHVPKEWDGKKIIIIRIEE